MRAWYLANRALAFRFRPLAASKNSSLAKGLSSTVQPRQVASVALDLAILPVERDRLH